MPTPSADAQAADGMLQLVNAADEPLVYLLFPARAARPVRETLPFDPADPPETLLPAGASAALFDCASPGMWQGGTVHLYRPQPSVSTAVLVRSVRLSDTLLEAARADGCRLIVDHLDADD